MYEVVRVVTSLLSWLVFRVRTIDADRVPASGAVILAPNHFSFMDHFFLGASLRRKVRFMAKSQLFKPPMQFVFSHGGVFPVRRGHRDEEAFITAGLILEGGGCVAMYCEGGRSRTGRIGDKARPGIGRLALESGATIVPVAVHGSSRVRNWRRLQFPKVTVQFGELLRYERVEEPTRDQQQAVADAILEEIRALYGHLDELGREASLAKARDERRARRAKRAAAA
jgi:1-acyl-sn-glycerol-3-phosphate acyltransferase